MAAQPIGKSAGMVRRLPKREKPGVFNSGMRTCGLSAMVADGKARVIARQIGIHSAGRF